MRALVAGLALAAVLLVGCGADAEGPGGFTAPAQEGQPAHIVVGNAAVGEYIASDGTLCVVVSRYDAGVYVTCDWRQR